MEKYVTTLQTNDLLNCLPPPHPSLHAQTKFIFLSGFYSKRKKKFCFVEDSLDEIHTVLTETWSHHVNLSDRFIRFYV